MARRKSSHRHRHRRTRARHTKRARHTRRTRRTHRTRRGGGSTPHPSTRMIPFGPNQTLDGGYFSRANQNGGGLINPNDPHRGGIGRHTGILQPTGSTMNVGGASGQMATYGVTGGRF